MENTQNCCSKTDNANNNDNKSKYSRENRYSYDSFLNEINKFLNSLENKLKLHTSQLSFPIIKKSNCKYSGIEFLSFELIIKENNSDRSSTIYLTNNDKDINIEIDYHNITEEEANFNSNITTTTINKNNHINTKSNLKYHRENNFLITCKIAYSEIYNSPILYFNIYDTGTNEIISWEEYKTRIDNKTNYTDDSGNTKTINNIASVLLNNNSLFEIEKSNFPYGGGVYYSLYLCNFSLFLNSLLKENNDSLKPDNIDEINDINDINVFQLWFSTILSYLGYIDYDINVFKNNYSN